MSATDKPRAAFTADGRHLAIRHRNWSDLIPADHVASWLAFYRRMAAKYGKRTLTYTQTADAIEAAQERARRRGVAA